MRVSKPSLTAADLERDLNPKPGSIARQDQEALEVLLKRAAKHEMSPEERRLQKLSFVSGMTGMTDAEILAVAPELRPCPRCSAVAADALATDGQAMELMAENAGLRAEVEEINADRGELEARNHRFAQRITSLRTALAAVTRVTTLMEAVHVAESAAGGGSVGCATQDVVGSDIEGTQV